jgi:hypothetical protein
LSEPDASSAPRTSSVRSLVTLYGVAWLSVTFIAGYSLLTMFEFQVLTIPAYTPAVHPGLLHYVLDPWQHWDGQWFLRIAQGGYFGDDGSAAFLPAFPWLIRVTAWFVGGDMLFAGCLVSWIAFAIALGLLFRLLRSDLGEETATLALVLLVAFPTAFFFHAVYTESCFLLFTVAAFVAARRERWFLAGLAALAATLTRWTGFALVPALAIEAWTRATEKVAPDSVEPMWQRLWSKEGVAALKRLSPMAVVGTVLPALALPLVLLILNQAILDPWGFSRAQRLWERHLAPPWMGLIDGAVVLLPGHAPFLEPLEGGFPRLNLYSGGFLEAHAYNLVAAVAGLWFAARALRTLRPSYGIFVLAGVLLPLMTPSRLQPLQSMPRFLVVLFPIFAVLAMRLKGRPLAFACTVAAFAMIQGFFVARFALWFWVA